MALTLIKSGKPVATFERRPRRVDCYCCFDMAAGSKYTCDNCGQGYSGRRLPEGQRPQNPLMSAAITGDQP